MHRKGNSEPVRGDGMAAITNLIERFLAIDIGYGSGDGSGDGSGSGYGDGYGYGYGYGSGDGSGSGDGDGYGYGYGDGSGDGDGYGYGYGDGSGYGYGYGSGDGDGYGYGYGLISFKGQKVYYIDQMPTVIENVHGNLAKGYTINGDLTTVPCFIAKGENKFAHGVNFEEAQKALQDKIFDDMDTDAKIDAFLNEFQPDVKYPAKSFYDWHHKLTGSCEFGRNSFIKNHGIDIETGMYTVNEFIEITKNDFGGDIIRQIEERINE